VTAPDGGAPAPALFSLRLPASWFELDVRPATRDGSIAAAVAERVVTQPDLREHRTELTRVLRRQARDAWEAGAIYCACFAMAAEDSLKLGIFGGEGDNARVRRRRAAW
jgi:hypothetical protein